jgi:hypothetical protein
MDSITVARSAEMTLRSRETNSAPNEAFDFAQPDFWPVSRILIREYALIGKTELGCPANRRDLKDELDRRLDPAAAGVHKTLAEEQRSAGYRVESVQRIFWNQAGHTRWRG